MNALQHGFAAILDQLAIWGPRVLLGVVFLVMGWIVARLLQRLVTALAVRIGVDRPFAQMAADGDMPTLSPMKLPSRILGVAVFWLVMLFAAVSFLTMLRLEAVALPFQTILVRISEWLPGLFAATILIVIGWVLATLVRNLMIRLMKAAHLDENLAKIGVITEDMAQQHRFASVVGIIVYSLVLMLFILPAVDALGLTMIATTLQGVVQTMADAIPNVLAAILVLAVAVLIAYLVRMPVTRLVAATGVDGLGKHIGLDSTTPRALSISSAVGHLVFWLIVLFAFPAALDRLGLEPLVAPLRDAWGMVIAMLPRMAAAAALMLAAVLIAKVLSPIVQTFLAGVGFDNVLQRVGLAGVHKKAMAGGDAWLPSRFVGNVVAFVVYLLFSIEALNALGLFALSALVGQLAAGLPSIVVAVAILAVALMVATTVARLVREATGSMTEVNSELAAGAAYVVIVLFGATMALEQLNVGGDVVQSAVLIMLAAIGIAFALALGLGLRPLIERWAGNRFGHWVDRKPGSGGGK
jgi:hypothetical protein